MALTDEEVRTANEPVVYVGLRAGEIYGVWANPPQDVPHEARYESDADVQAFRCRPPVVRTAVQKLAAAGLSVAELKQVLGLPE